MSIVNRSYVSMEQHQCVACTAVYDSGAILLDRRLRDSMESRTLTAWGLCPECTKYNEDGYLTMVGIDPDKSRTMTPDGVYRTGVIARIRRSAAERVFKDGLIDGKPVVWVSDAVIEKLEQMQGEADET